MPIATGPGGRSTSPVTTGSPAGNPVAGDGRAGSETTVRARTTAGAVPVARIATLAPAGRTRRSPVATGVSAADNGVGGPVADHETGASSGDTSVDSAA